MWSTRADSFREHAGIEWLETAQINQQENDVVSKDTLVPFRYSSGSSCSKSGGGSAVHFFRTNYKIREEWEGSDDEEEDFEYRESPVLAAFKPPRRHENCRVCQQLEKEGDTRELYDDHIHNYPLATRNTFR